MPVFFLFFIVSGFCSLVYQVAWLRIAMADFGVTTVTISMVLSVFMAGLSFGSWGGGRLAISACKMEGRSHLRLYGALEVMIAFSGIVPPFLLDYGRSLLLTRAGTEWGSGVYYLASSAVIFASIVPFCICMGGTFPIAMAAVKRIHPEKSGTSFSYLYLANLLGAVLGCAGTAFILIELVGFQGVMLIAAALNLLIGAAAFFFSLRIRQAAPAEELRSSTTVSLKNKSFAGIWTYAVLLLTGMASMALEVIWIRQFTPFLGPVVYTFASILVIFLMANYAGSSFYRLKSDHQQNGDEVCSLGVMLALAGLAAMLAMLTADYRLPIPINLFGGILRIAAGVAPFGFMLGFITPWIVDRLSGGEAAIAGRAYAVNTVGCVLGPLMAGFLLLPLLGEKWSIFSLGLPFFLLSILLVMRAIGQGEGKRPFPLPINWILPSTIVGAILLVTLTKDFEKRYPDAVVMRDYTATVVAAGNGMDKRLLVNGFGMTVMTPVTKMMVHLPMAMHESPPRHGLVLCFGMGTSFRSMLSWGIPTTVVELVPSIPKLMGYYHEDAANAFGNPLSRVVIDDARRFLDRTTEHFDVIVLDPPPPVEAAASSLLYSREFYLDVAARLADGGVFHQWTDSKDPYQRATIVKSLIDVFPFVRVFGSFDGIGIHCIASMRPVPLRDSYELASQLPARAATDIIEWGPYDSSEEQFREMLSLEEDVREVIEVAQGARIIQDDRPLNEYYLLRLLLRRDDHG
jgi:predicted membrane-bound spermidine synthase